jgi:preprotein translocase subunit SecE
LADKDKKVRHQNAIQRYFTETSGELRKVSWPTRQEAVQLTILVVIVMVAMAIFLGLVDLAASKLLNLLLGV